MHIVCGHCFAVNRRWPERLVDVPLCGVCGETLLSGEPLTSRGFTPFIERNDLPVVVDFWAQRCGPCLTMASQFARAADEFKRRVRFAKLDTDGEPQLASRYGIRSILSLVLFRGGVESDRRSGVLTARQIVEWLQPNLQQERA